MQQRTCPECRVKMEEVQLLDRAPGVAPRQGLWERQTEKGPRGGLKRDHLKA